MATSLWMSKMRYGLQPTNKVRLTEEDLKTSHEGHQNSSEQATYTVGWKQD